MKNLIESMNAAVDSLVECSCQDKADKKVALGRVEAPKEEAKLSPLVAGKAGKSAAEQTVEQTEAADLALPKMTADELGTMLALSLFLVRNDKAAITFANLHDKLAESMPDVKAQHLRLIARSAIAAYKRMANAESSE